MKYLGAAILLLASPTAALAQDQPYKLIIIYDNKSIAVADYPSKARCEAAVRALADWTAQEDSDSGVERLPGGGVIVTTAHSLEGICIPG